MRLVVDASVTVQVCLAEAGFGLLADHELTAPVLLRFEVLSVLHEAQWHERISPDLARTARDRLLTAPVSLSRDVQLSARAWDVGDRLGWAKTYDAEYVALAVAEELPLLTIDRRLARGAARLVRTMGPEDL